MKTNVARPKPKTHGGSPAQRGVSVELMLRRSVMACMLFENEFYEDGVSIAARISDLVGKAGIEAVSNIAIEAREAMKLRHVPLLLAREATRHYKGRAVGDLIARVIQRPDEAAELIAIYWKDGKKSLPAQMKIGIARALKKFDDYAMAKWASGADVKLRDAIFLCHPHSHGRPALGRRFAKLVNKSFIPEEIAEQYGIEPNAVGLASPETWENKLSRGEDKRTTFEGLIVERKLGALATLRNLRGMVEAKVEPALIRDGINQMKTERVLPFRFIAAAKYAMQFEPELEAAMFRCIEGSQKLPGRTALLIDVSQSMSDHISAKSEMKRVDAACGLGMIARELCETVRVFSFSDALAEVPPRRGFALRDAIDQSQPHGSTALHGAVATLNANVEYDRLIVITDEQATDSPFHGAGMLQPRVGAIGYVINVASYKNGVRYSKFVHIDGWSEAVFDYIVASEIEAANAFMELMKGG